MSRSTLIDLAFIAFLTFASIIVGYVVVWLRKYEKSDKDFREVTIFGELYWIGMTVWLLATLFIVVVLL